MNCLWYCYNCRLCQCVVYHLPDLHFFLLDVSDAILFVQRWYLFIVRIWTMLVSSTSGEETLEFAQSPRFISKVHYSLVSFLVAMLGNQSQNFPYMAQCWIRIVRLLLGAKPPNRRTTKNPKKRMIIPAGPSYRPWKQWLELTRKLLLGSLLDQSLSWDS